MDQSGASVYVYAKASGMIARSFIGKKTQQLFDVHSLQDLWMLVFKNEVPLIPEVMLAQKIEKTAEEHFIKDYKMLIACYDKPADVLVQLLRFYDYRNLKAIGAALCSGDTKMPDISDIGIYSRLDYSAWPDLKRITRKSPVSWYNTVPTWENQKELDRRLDVQYTKDLWNSVQSLPVLERETVSDFLQQQIILQNCEWALRLRVYYNMNRDEIIPWLVCDEKEGHKNDTLAGQAIRMLDLPLDDYSAWHAWKYKSLLNVSNTAEWKLDPRWFEQAVSRKINKIALSMFHKIPFSSLVLVSWFKIKQNELNMIRTATERLRLNVSDSQLQQFIGVQLG